MFNPLELQFFYIQNLRPPVKMQPPVKALVFDVLGTVVDWRSGIMSEVEAAGRRHGMTPGKVTIISLP